MPRCSLSLITSITTFKYYDGILIKSRSRTVNHRLSLRWHIGLPRLHLWVDS